MTVQDEQNLMPPALTSDTFVVNVWNGIGDLVMHLPHIHSLAQRSESGKICLLTRRHKQASADEILKDDPAIEHIFFHEGRDLFSLMKFYANLRRYAFKEAWILHNSTNHAAGCWLAGISKRYGYGFGSQRRFLTHPIEGYQRSLFAQNYRVWPSTQLLESQGVSIPEGASKLCLSDTVRDQINQRFGTFKRPLVGLGIGATDSRKQWAPEKFAVLISALRSDFPGTFFLWGHASDQPIAQTIQRDLGSKTSDVHPVLDLKIRPSIALMEQIDLFIGNDSALLNIAAAAEKPAIGIYGLTVPLVHSKHFIAVSPPHYVYSDTAIETIQPDHVLATLTESMRIQNLRRK